MYNGENLIAPDHTENSQITENPSYKIDMVLEGEEGDYTYSFYSNRAESFFDGGFRIMFTEEIKKFGAGTYEFSFRLRASSPAQLIGTWRYDDPISYTRQETPITASSAWKDVTLSLSVTEEMLENKLFAVGVNGTGSEFDYFTVSDLQLIKK